MCVSYMQCLPYMLCLHYMVLIYMSVVAPANLGLCSRIARTSVQVSMVVLVCI